MVHAHSYICMSCDTKQQTFTFHSKTMLENRSCDDNIDLKFYRNSKCADRDISACINSYASWTQVLDYNVHADNINNMTVHEWFHRQHINNELNKQQWLQIHDITHKFHQKFTTTFENKKTTLSQYIENGNMNENILNCHKNYIDFILSILQYIGIINEWITPNNFNNNNTNDMECSCCQLQYDSWILFMKLAVGTDIMPLMSHISQYSQTYHMVCPYCICQPILRFIYSPKFQIQQCMKDALSTAPIEKQKWYISWYDMSVASWRYAHVKHRYNIDKYL